MTDHPLAREWAIVQTQCDSYEKHSLLIKLVAIVLVAVSLLIQPGLPLPMAAIVGILWLQDAIWKTFQQRIEARLLFLERELAAAHDDEREGGKAYQLHTNFQVQRQQGGMVKEYLSSAFRPTVAFPYVVLLVALGLMAVLTG